MKRKTVIYFLLGLLVPAVIQAHHGPTNSPALYKTDELIILEGTITGVLWRNPHVRMKIQVEDGNGQPEIWELETTVPSILKRVGITSELIDVGDKVKAAGFVSRRDSHSIGLQNLLLPDGREYTGPGGELRWSDRPVSRVKQGIDKSRAVSASKSASGLSRIWTRWPGMGGDREGYDHLLTEIAREGKTAYDPVNHPVLDCAPRGMPEMVLTPAPMELVELPDRIVMHSIWPGRDRVFFLDEETAPPASEADHLGYSVGRWEDENTLVVTTNNVNWPYFDRAGTPQSTEVSYVERFTMDADRTRLDYRVTATDPVMFTAPVDQTYFWTWVPGEQVPPNDCVRWDDSGESSLSVQSTTRQ